MQKELRIGSSSKVKFDGGICYGEDTNIDLNQSPYGGLLNMTLDNGGMPIKRKGQINLFQNSLGTGGIKGIYANFKGNTIIVHGTTVYKQSGNSEPTVLYSGYEGANAYMFTYNGILYILSGLKYYQYNSSEFKEVVPYIPRLQMNRKPDGSESTVDESWNMLGDGFRETFNGNGTDKVYKLSLSNLNPVNPSVKISGVANTDFTVDYVKAEITFATAPATGTNNVEITAYKSFDKLKENIKNCTFGTEFSNRMFLSGNSNVPNFYFASGLSDNNDVSYFPQKYQYAIKGEDKAISGMKVQYNKLIVFKEDLTALVTASTGLDNLASFPISFLNTDVGCDIPNSIQLIDNNIVFANSTKGVNMIVSTVIQDEKAIIPISNNINGDSFRRGLIYEDKTLLKSACSVDFDSKYILNVGEKCYVWDYKDKYSLNDKTNLKWFIWDNIKANQFIVRDNELLYGHKENGMLCKFTDVLNDFGNAINGVWKTKLMDFGNPDYYKTVMNLWYTCKANTGSSVNIKYFNDKGETVSTENISSNRVNSFSWNNFSWSSFTWNVQTVAPTFKLKAKIKKIRYFQIELSNNEPNQNLSILDLVIQYNLTKRVK